MYNESIGASKFVTKQSEGTILAELLYRHTKEQQQEGTPGLAIAI